MARQAPDLPVLQPVATGREHHQLDERQRAQAWSWARRQATRCYGHLPAELVDQAVGRAMDALPAGEGAKDRRALRSGLAAALDAELRRVHADWCAGGPTARRADGGSGARPAPATGEDADARLAAFLEHGLGGLERAVLQLELGAGRQTASVRAALRLGPRQYARHRGRGLAKLRDVLLGEVSGRVCEAHRSTVVDAVTGDRAAASRLASGDGRCRECAREARALGLLLTERLAAAPWPFAITPLGGAAAKLAAGSFAVKRGIGGGRRALFQTGSPAGYAAPGVALLAATAVAVAAVGARDRHDGPAVASRKPAVAAQPFGAGAGRPAPAAEPAAGSHDDRPAPRAARGRSSGPRHDARSAVHAPASPPQAPVAPVETSGVAVDGGFAGTPASAPAPSGAVTRPRPPAPDVGAPGDQPPDRHPLPQHGGGHLDGGVTAAGGAGQDGAAPDAPSPPAAPPQDAGPVAAPDPEAADAGAGSAATDGAPAPVTPPVANPEAGGSGDGGSHGGPAEDPHPELGQDHDGQPGASVPAR